MTSHWLFNLRSPLRPAKALSTLLSTAALDKLPQSQERGITLDLGFSAFFIPVPPALADRYDTCQITLVDCPGHASLIRTIIGGAGIIDLMLLVLDATKGIQTQTAECLVIGEILTESMMVVLNKTDLLLDAVKALPKIEKNLRTVFANTKFGRDVTIVPVSANPGSKDDLKIKEGRAGAAAGAADEGAASSSAASTGAPSAPQVSALIEALKSTLHEVPARRAAAAALAAASLAASSAPAASAAPSSSSSSAVVSASPAALPPAPFLFAVDHCFAIRGSGTVLTGTVLSGSVRVGASVEIAHLGVEKKVKSMQRFRQPVDYAEQGDRVGICVTQLDSKLVERGLLCTPGSVHTYTAAIAVVDKIRFYKGAVSTKSKFHVSIGHATAMATAIFFGGKGEEGEGDGVAGAGDTASSSSSSSSSAAAAPAPASAATPTRVAPPMLFDFARDYPYLDELHGASAAYPAHSQFALLQFEKPVQAPLQSVLLGSKLDADPHANSCRIAFAGRLLCGVPWDTPEHRSRLRLFQDRVREGVIDRVLDRHTLIGRDLFAKGADLSLFLGKAVQLELQSAQPANQGAQAKNSVAAAAPQSGAAGSQPGPKGSQAGAAGSSGASAAPSGSVSGSSGIVRGTIDSAFGQAGKFKAVFPGGLPITSKEAAELEAFAASEDAAAASAASSGPPAKARKAPRINLKGKILMKFRKYKFALDKKAIVQQQTQQ